MGIAGIDTLDGQGDDDELTGGDDVDTVNGGTGADTVFEDAATGDDRQRAARARTPTS